MRIFKKQTWFAVARNLIFWAVSFFVLLRLFNRTEYINPIDVIYTFLFHIPLWIGVGLHAYALRNSFDKGKYGVYAFQFLLLTLTVIPQGYFFSFDVLADWIFPDFYFVAVYSWPEIIGIGAIYVIITLLLHVAISWSKQQEELKKVSELREQKRTAELQALRAQINPHFLFNTLNTIYGETLKKTEKAPALVLQLSDILRYVVDTSKKEEVPVADEITYIQNFITLQKQRYSRPGQIYVEIKGDPGTKKIAPLILITFIENCFKHGQLNADSDFIRIIISVNYKKLVLITSNTYNEAKNELEAESTSTGLENVKRRLELRYGGMYALEEKAGHGVYQTTLTLHYQK